MQRYGNPAWAATIKLTTQRPDGQRRDYLLKLTRGDLAGPRVLGEYACMTELGHPLRRQPPPAGRLGQQLDLLLHQAPEGRASA